MECFHQCVKLKPPSQNDNYTSLLVKWFHKLFGFFISELTSFWSACQSFSKVPLQLYFKTLKYPDWEWQNLWICKLPSSWHSIQIQNQLWNPSTPAWGYGSMCKMCAAETGSLYTVGYIHTIFINKFLAFFVLEWAPLVTSGTEFLPWDCILKLPSLPCSAHQLSLQWGFHPTVLLCKFCT